MTKVNETLAVLLKFDELTALIQWQSIIKFWFHERNYKYVDLIKNNLYYREICTLHLAGKMLINKGIVLKLTTSAAENSKVAVDVIKKGKSYNS